MKYHNLGNFTRVDQYIDFKLSSLRNSEPSFKSLFELMFSEEKNIIFEYTYGFDIRKVTYGDSKNNIISLANKINGLNLNPNSVIAIHLDNDITWIETFWAILRSGHRPLLLNTRLDDASLLEAIKETDCKLLITNRKKLDCPFITYRELLTKEEVEVNGEFGEEIFFMSSGTSENVKLCSYSALEFKNIILQSKDIIKNSKRMKRFYHGEIKLLMFLPLYHIFGFIALYIWFSFYARTFVGLNDLSPQTIKETINKHEVTHIFAVPLFWQKTYETAIKEIKKRGDKTYNKFLKGISIRKKLGNSLLGKLFSKIAFKEVREGMFSDSISILISGGSYISNEVLAFFNSIGYPLANGYGMTEIGITSVELSSKFKDLTSGSIGRPLNGLTYIINENDELLVKGDTLARYIIINGKRISKDEYFNTHDLMEYKDHHYYFLGRKDDLIVSSNGENLNPNIIEERIRLSSVPNIALISDSTNGDAILLVEVNKYLSKDKVNEIDKELKENIIKNNYKSLITKIVYIKEPFIKGEEFKINRKRLARDYFASKLDVYDLSSDNKAEEQDEILKKLNDIVKEVLNESGDSKDLFLDLGASSLDYYAIASAIYDEFSVNIIGDDLKLTTVKDIAKFIKEQL